MNHPAFRAIWVDRYRQNEDGYREVAASNPFGNNWELNTDPAGWAEHQLMSALEILYGGGDPSLVLQFLSRCLAIAERTLAEGKLTSDRCRVRYPRNHGELLRARVYAEVLSGEAFDESALEEPAGALARSCHEDPRWNDMDAATYLEFIRLALLGNHQFTPQETKALRPSLKRAARWYKEEANLLFELIQSSGTGVTPLDEAFRSRFETYFDQVRDPAYHPQWLCKPYLLRLDLGLLRDKFLTSTDGQINWKRSIDSITN